MIDRMEIMTNAIRLRRQFGEDSSSPIDVFAIAGNIDNLSLVFYPMGENLSGMCVKGTGKVSVICINSEMSKGRQRYSLAHEFYHLFFDNNMVALCGKEIGFGKDVEKKADLFASYFLMPNDEIIKKADLYLSKHKKLSIEDIIHIEQYFGVSHKAAVIRLRENKYLSQSETDEYLQMSVKCRAEAMGLDGDLYRPLPDNKKYGTYGYYIEQADKLLKSDLISEGKYESLLLEAFRPDLVYGDNEGGDIID